MRDTSATPFRFVVTAVVATRRLVALSLDGSVDGGAADTEEVGDLGGAVFAAVYQRDQVGLWATVALWLLAMQPSLGLGDLPARSGAEPDQVGLENLATMASTLNRSHPTKSVGS